MCSKDVVYLGDAIYHVMSFSISAFTISLSLFYGISMGGL